METADELLTRGTRKVRWARMHMRLLQGIAEEFVQTRPFAGITIGANIHVEPKTAVLCEVLHAGGAEVVITGNVGSTKDDVVAALRASGIMVYGRQADSVEEHMANVRRVLSHRPALLLDNGADLVAEYLAGSERWGLLAGTEETTTGANRLREDMRGAIAWPIIVINDSPLKLIMENEHGVGPVMIEGFMRETNLQVQAKRFAVIGYGSVGRGIARRLRVLGGHVHVVEPDPIRALEAALDGMGVATLDQAIAGAEIFFTATGRPDAIPASAIDRLRDGAMLANAGHFAWEIAVEHLRSQAVAVEPFREWVELFMMPDGRQITLLARGEMLNLAGGNGNAIETMDIGFALQARSLAYLAAHHAQTPPGAQPVSHAINTEVAAAMVAALSRHESR